MIDFINDLQSGGSNRGFKPNTIEIQKRHINYFLSFLESHAITINETNYNTMLSYVAEMKTKGLKTRTINERLRAVSTYFNYLIDEKDFTFNPAEGMKLKGVKRPLIQEWFTQAELEEILKHYKENYKNKRSQLMLSLLVHQGLASRDLLHLSHEDFNLNEGTVYLQETSISARRTLSLKPFQILELHTFLTENELNITHDHIAYLTKQLKRFTGLKKLHHLRESVIIHWLKHYNLREVQEMAGHKYVSTTERYQVNDMKKLKDEIDQFHPLKNAD